MTLDRRRHLLSQHLLSAGLFLVATELIVVAFVASLFMETVPLRGHESGREPVASFAD